MSTVTDAPRTIEGVLVLEFERFAVAETVTAPLPGGLTAMRRADELALLGLEALTAVDVTALELLHGPLRSLVWSATVVPLPASVWMLVGACAWLGVMARWMAARR